ncbi:hypothetical protein GCM10010123_40000 [Pilimelia anulata]|uniref:Toxin n=1 Tax=Pilimelia anulata TaxID=53371 RepID=A0A8J3FCG6_9ACTN|nr:hypothetical protein [Pilimelia anulata]GGK06149.1 hypothetical protein GCM10010123_40000 [Pilimelia anulata]
MPRASYTWAASAAEHGISRQRIRFVIERCGLPFAVPPEPPDRPFERLLFLGDDRDGTELEVMAVEMLDDSLYVIHAMKMRARYRKQYREAKSCRK